MKIQVKMTARDIFDFSMYSAYSGFAGIFTFVFLILVIGILGYAWSSVAVMQRVMLLGCIILFVFVQPIMIWMKAKRMIQPKSMTLCITATELHAYPRIPMTRIRNTNVKIPANPE